MKKLIIIMITLSSCSPELIQDESLLIYLNNVRDQMLQRGVDFSIDFDLILESDLSEHGGNAVGKSTRTNRINKNNAIRIDKEKFDSLQYIGHYWKIEYILLHEIGHNVFGMGHMERPVNNERPVVMYPYGWKRIRKDDINNMYDAFSEVIKN
jgi:hypothetical protein